MKKGKRKKKPRWPDDLEIGLYGGPGDGLTLCPLLRSGDISPHVEISLKSGNRYIYTPYICRNGSFRYVFIAVISKTGKAKLLSDDMDKKSKKGN